MRMISRDTKHVRRIGWVRASPRFPEKAQRAAVERHARTIYSSSDDATVYDMVKSLRAGDEVYVHGLHRLGETRAEFTAALEAIRVAGAKCFDTETETFVDVGCIEAAAAAIGVINGERRMPTSALARRRGKMGGAVPQLAKVPHAEAKAIWADKDLTNEQAAQRIGLSVRTCYRRYGDSGRPAGWPKGPKRGKR